VWLQGVGTVAPGLCVKSIMRFTKMQGVGNDFVLVDEAEADAGVDWNELARQVCARRIGIGADGLLVAGHAADEVDLSMRMFNPDGSEDMCGNGLRCVALWAHRAGWTRGACFVVATKEGLRRVEMLDTGEAQGLVRVDMGLPRFAPADIPFLGTSNLSTADDSVLRSPLTVDGETYAIASVNTGSTHTVIFGDAPSEDEFRRVSPIIETHPLFPERTSVLWATLTGQSSIQVRIWERGAGETWGCGTGACAVGVLARVLKLVPEGAVDVVSKGGTLRIDWPGAGQEIRMTGPAQVVFEGEVESDAADRHKPHG